MSVIWLGGAFCLGILGGIILLVSQFGMTEPLEAEETALERNAVVGFLIFIATLLLVWGMHYIKLAYGL